MQQHAHPAPPVVATDDDKAKPETAVDSPRPKKQSRKNKASVGSPSRPGTSKPRKKTMKRRCHRRRLEGICPEGSLVTGRGTRYVLADTETLRLIEKSKQLFKHMRDLEEALRLIHAEHPLLQKGLPRIKGQY